jgi:hypothetical protein
MNEETRQRKIGAAADRIGGLDGALRFLDQLPERVAQRVLKPALAAALKTGAAAAAAEARMHATDSKDRKGTHLFQTAGSAVAAKGTAAFGKVGYFGKAGSHGWLVEHGHRLVRGGTLKAEARSLLEVLAGVKRRRQRKARDESRTGQGQTVGQVQPHPILAPAQRKAEGPMTSAFTEEVILRSDRELKKLARESGAA